jgi:hypothetical protein
MARRPRHLVDRAALARRVAATPVTETPQPGTDEYQVIDWLTRLHLLQGVPFAYLVPDIRMLPAESIRFFQLDNGWIEALIDGAFGVGAPRATAGGGAVLRAGAVRAARAGATSAAAQGIPETITGFLLRSAVVSGWPGLETRCYGDTAAQQPLPLVRLERVAPSVLLCLAGGVVRRADLAEPAEGVHFGVDRAPGTGWQKQLRYASGNATTPAGSWIPGQSQPVPLRSDRMSVIRINALAQAMAPHVWAQPPPTPAVFTSAQFGLEMVEGVQSASFQVGA